MIFPQVGPMIVELYCYSDASQTLQSRLSSVLPLHLALKQECVTEVIIGFGSLGKKVGIYKEQYNKRIQNKKN